MACQKLPARNSKKRKPSSNEKLNFKLGFINFCQNDLPAVKFKMTKASLHQRKREDKSQPLP
jgi:hypothetical protein